MNKKLHIRNKQNSGMTPVICLISICVTFIVIVLLSKLSSNFIATADAKESVVHVHSITATTPYTNCDMMIVSKKLVEKIK